ncbi:MAG: MFS transporter [Deltaproteobacteria bacterium]|nr:MFS transporter [Deltaproteobacteria bacterium]
MIKLLQRLFGERPAIPLLPEPEVERAYRHWRRRMLYASIIGYGLFYFVRKNISIALPLLAADLGYSNTQLGVLGSLLYVSYGTSKALFGLVSDRIDPRRFMAFGLFVSALLNIFFSFSHSLFFFSLFWLLNGVFQATGAPPSAKICVRWFSISERGTKWALWNISHQAGGGLILVIAGWLGMAFGWRAVFWGPAVIALFGVLFILDRVRDRPEALGLPPIDVYRDDPELISPEDSERSQWQLIVARVLLNPRLLLLALSSLCIYVVRYGTLDWAAKYLVEAKGQSLGVAGQLASLIEFAGIPGMLLAGWLTDRFFNSRRAPVVIISLFAVALSMAGFYLVPPGHPWLDALALSAVGFFTYGPQMLVAGVAAADACGTQVAAAAVGITGLFSYIGAIVSSAGTGVAVDRWGWGGGFGLWIVASLVGAVLLLPLWKMRGRRG